MFLLANGNCFPRSWVESIFFSKDKSFPFCTFQRGRRWNLHQSGVTAANADVYQQVKWVPRQCRLMGAQLQALKWDGKVSRLHGGAWERQVWFIALNHTNKGKWVTQACACLHRGQHSREAHPSSHLVENRPRGSSCWSGEHHFKPMYFTSSPLGFHMSHERGEKGSSTQVCILQDETHYELTLELPEVHWGQIQSLHEPWVLLNYPSRIFFLLPLN